MTRGSDRGISEGERGCERTGKQGGAGARE